MVPYNPNSMVPYNLNSKALQNPWNFSTPKFHGAICIAPWNLMDPHGTKYEIWYVELGRTFVPFCLTKQTKTHL